uniref:Uncharacterized protein n=1 Tax=Nelumbo nucifera TaxID=4432 RepID=A0A822Y5Z0_NELNU|nr:TPA_asm: hypothetical protein HUJ06_028053 [Nelumbo nucifera]
MTKTACNSTTQLPIAFAREEFINLEERTMGNASVHWYYTILWYLEPNILQYSKLSQIYEILMDTCQHNSLHRGN